MGRVVGGVLMRMLVIMGMIVIVIMGMIVIMVMVMLAMLVGVIVEGMRHERVWFLGLQELCYGHLLLGRLGL